jgi:hypothetical protein
MSNHELLDKFDYWYTIYEDKLHLIIVEETDWQWNPPATMPWRCSANSTLFTDETKTINYNYVICLVPGYIVCVYG